MGGQRLRAGGCDSRHPLDQVNAALAAHIDPGALRVVLVGRLMPLTGSPSTPPTRQMVRASLVSKAVPCIEKPQETPWNRRTGGHG